MACMGQSLTSLLYFVRTGMKHELIECITSEELFVDLNDDPQFRKAKLSELLTESKVVVYFPDYMLLVSR